MIYQPRVMFRPKRKPFLTLGDFALGFFVGLALTLMFALIVGALS